MKLRAGLFAIMVLLLMAYCACNKQESNSPADTDIYKVATTFLSNEIGVRPEEIISDTTFKIEQDPDSTYTVGMFVKLKNVTRIKLPESILRDSYTLTLKYKGGDPKNIKNWLIQDLEYDE
ncbi:MAG: hypothetical protein JSS96_16320 [Bacteroidetes bacterium]|nr:hypothetical protein [Bacteroidota bacterium]